MDNLLTKHLDIWTAAQAPKTVGGRGRGRKANGTISPHGIKKLRELILELAVRGKLVPQNLDDEPASVLLEKIATEKARLLKEKKIKKQKKLPEIREEEKPFTLPVGWAWVRFGELPFIANTGIDKGKAFQNHDFKYPYFKMNNILNDGGFDLTDITRVDATHSDLEKYKLEDGDFLFNTRNSRELVGKTCVIRGVKNTNILYNNNILRAKMAFVSPEFVDCWFRSVSGKALLEAKKSNTTNVCAIYQGKLFEMLCVVPPLPEQHRIVATVDELMALCDRLELLQSNSNATHQALLATLLTSLTTATDPADFSETWQRTQDHFHTLFTSEDSIDQLKQTILQLAVMGKLVTQNPDDEPASVLLKKIADEKARLIKEKKIKKQKPLIDFQGLHELKGHLPSHWERTRLIDIADVVRGGSPRPAGDPRYYDGKIPFLKVANVSNVKGKMIEGYTFTIKEAGLKKTRFIDTRTVLLTNSGATLGIPAICNFAATFNDGIAAFIELSENVFDEYLYLYLKSLSKWFIDIASRGQGQPNLNTDIIKATWFALPPLAEQHRIVAKVDELMALCDTLKARLSESQTTQINLANAMIEQAISPEVEQ